MLRFTIFGVPVTVEPFFWVVTALLGRALPALQSNNAQEMLWVLVWMVIAFISILAHELGHALTGIRTAGGQTWIKLWAMGGLAYHQGSRFTKKSRALTIIAGPAAGFCIFFLVAAFMMIRWPNGIGFEILLKAMIFNLPISPEAVAVYKENYQLMRILDIFVWINFWWGVLNLLPIHPLDGGQLTACYIRSPKKVHQIGFIVAGATALIGFYFIGLFAGVMFGYFAYINYQQYRQAGW